MRHRGKWLATAVALILSLPGVASAYAPPSEFIVKQIVQKRQALRTARLRSVITLFEGERPGSAHFRQTSWYVAANGLLRTWITDDHDRKLYVLERTGRNWGPVISLLLEPQAPELVRALRARKIPVVTEAELMKFDTEEQRRDAESTSVERLKGANGQWLAAAWLIGRSPKSGPQLWVDKDSQTPLRFVFDRASDNDTFDVRFEGYRFQKDLPLPRSLLVTKGTQQPFFREEFTEASVNLEDAQFKMPAAGATGFTDVGNALPSEVRNLILQYAETVH